MFYCERCSGRFNATVAAAAAGCPRCKEKYGVAGPLRFRLFERAAPTVAGRAPGRADPPIRLAGIARPGREAAAQPKGPSPN